MEVQEFFDQRKELISTSNGDIFDKLSAVEPIKQFKDMGIYPYFKSFENAEGRFATIDGRKIMMFGSNNYSGLGEDERIKEAVKKGVDKYGVSATGSRFLNGNLSIHEELEKEVASFVNKEAALVFGTGYQTNLGAISSIISKNDVIILDEYSHASIIDGARLSRGETKFFKHNDMDDLIKVLKSIPGTKGKLIAADGLFSMEGDIAPIDKLFEIAKKYDARTLIDEAHSIGIYGENGKGLVYQYGLSKEIDIITGTFSKSLTSQGGFVAADKDVIEFIKHFGRAMIFSASLTPANTSAALESLKILQKEGFRAEKVRKNGDLLREELIKTGVNTGESVSPIVPIITGDPQKTIAFWQLLFSKGFYVNPVFPPAVPPDRSMLRVSVMATHTEEDILSFVNAVKEIKNEIM